LMRVDARAIKAPPGMVFRERERESGRRERESMRARVCHGDPWHSSQRMALRSSTICNTHTHTHTHTHKHTHTHTYTHTDTHTECACARWPGSGMRRTATLGAEGQSPWAAEQPSGELRRVRLNRPRAADPAIEPGRREKRTIRIKR
jgi:hypothetical protein